MFMGIPYLTLGLWAALAVGALWLVDEIGDRREAKVEARLLPRIEQAETERDQWVAAHKQLLDDAKRLDDENAEKLTTALEARDAAELAHGGDAPASARVRPRGKSAPAAAGKDGGGGSWLQWLPALPGGFGKGGAKGSKS